MRKLLIGLLAVLATGCVVAPPSGVVYVEPAPLVVEPAYVYYGGVYGFWWGGCFYERSYWRPGFHGGVPYRYGRPNWNAPRGVRFHDRHD